MINKIKKIVIACVLMAGTPALAAIYMVMPQDGGTSMQTGLSKAEGADGWRPEMPGDIAPISVSLTPGILPETIVGQHYKFSIPLGWVTVSGDESFDDGNVIYSINSVNSSGVFGFIDNALSGTIIDEKTYLFDLTAEYKGHKSNTVTLSLNANDWHIDDRGVVFCLGAEKGSEKILNGKTYISSGDDKAFAATNYSNACTSNLVDMSEMPWPNKTKFNGVISHWDTSRVTTMRQLFAFAHAFNQSVSNFDTGNVTTMRHMFWGAHSFNQPVSNFDTENVTDMAVMFEQANSFNHPVSNFNTSNVTDMYAMFIGNHKFNQSVSNFDTSKVTNMARMFQDAWVFNHSLSNFDTSNVKNMTWMFERAYAFNQNLSSWCVTEITGKPGSFDEGAASWNKINRQPIWGTCPNL